MADSETVDTTQQVTSETPATKQKNPKRVAAGKAIARSPEKALAESQVIIANNQLKQAEPPAVSPPVADTPPAEPAKITTIQWLRVISIAVSLAGIYYKRKEIKSVLTPKKPQVYTPPPVPPNSTVDHALPRRKGGIKPMD